MIVINLFGGPGAGKSTTAAGLFWLLKNQGVTVELITEYAKALTWAKRSVELSDQFYIYAKQHHRQFVLKDQVEFCITDSPLLLPILYNVHEPSSFDDYVIDNWNGYTNVNFFIQREKPYSAIGRNQTEAEAKQLDKETRDLLRHYDVPYTEILGNPFSPYAILEHLTRKGLLPCASNEK